MFVPRELPPSKFSDDVIARELWFGASQSKILATPMHGVGGAAFRAVHPQITAFVPQVRANFCTSTRGPENFCPKNRSPQMLFYETASHIEQRWSPRGRPWPRGRPRGHILKSLALALASKPQVLGLGLGLEALGPRKLPCPRLEDSTIFEQLKFC